MSYNDFIKRTQKNYDRFNEVYEKTSFLESDIDFLRKIDVKLKLLIIAENWCSDSFLIGPIMHKMSEYSPQLEVLFLPRDDILDEFNKHYLTGGKAKIPFLLFLNERNEETHRWVERTTQTFEKIMELKNQNLEKAVYYKEVLKLFLSEESIVETAKILMQEVKRAVFITKTTL